MLKVCCLCAVPDYPTDKLHINAVAARIKGKVYSLPAPNRHHNVVQGYRREHGQPAGAGTVQGFMDNEGNFLTRMEAMIVARAANQLIPNSSHIQDTLYSEDLW